MKHRRPPHLYVDDTWYMVTASTYQCIPYLQLLRQREYFCALLHRLLPEYSISLDAWVVLDDHYHLLLKTQDGMQLPRFLQRLHGSTARQFNLWNATSGTTIWYSYWDTCIRDMPSYWTRFNYIHYNPVKHGYVGNPLHWEYSSYSRQLQELGSEFMQDVMMRYPVHALELAKIEGDAD